MGPQPRPDRSKLAGLPCRRSPNGAPAVVVTDNPEATQERIEALFARFDAEIATQRADAAARPTESRDAAAQDVAALERQRRDLQQAWIGARLARAGASAGELLRGLGESLGRGMEDAGRRLRDSMQGGNDRPPPGE